MLAVLRIVAGAIFVSFGTMKLFGYPPSPEGPHGPVDLASQMGVAGVLELVGGLCIVLGIATRPVAFVLAGEMAVAYFQVHFPKSFFPVSNQGVPAVLYCFLFLYFVAAGPGAWSLDGVIARHPLETANARVRAAEQTAAAARAREAPAPRRRAG